MNTNCPGCGKTLAVPPGYEAGQLICPFCQLQFAASGQSPPPMPEGYGPAAQHTGEVSQRTLMHLRGTRPWVMFLAIMLVIGAGLTALAGLAALVMGQQTGVSAPMMVGMAYLVGTVFYLVPAILMFKYTSAIGTLLNFPNVSLLENAVEAQKNYWRVLGILVIIGMILGLILFVSAMALAAQHAAGGNPFGRRF